MAATTGLLRHLTPDEVEGVMAHELAHVKNRDTLIMAFTATISGAIVHAGQFRISVWRRATAMPGWVPFGHIIMLILAPLGAMIVQMAISRTREYAADRGGAEISGKPLALASALRRIAIAGAAHARPPRRRNPAMAHMYIINPLAGFGMRQLFATHPATERRIAELEAMAPEFARASTSCALGGTR